MKRPIFLYAALAILFAFSATYQARYSKDFIRGRAIDFPLFSVTPETNKIASVSPAARSFGLEKGDELIAVNGRPYRGSGVLVDARRNVRVGVPVVLTILPVNASGSGTEAISLPVRRARISLWDIPEDLLLQVLLPSFCLLLGFWVAFLRPRDPRAWLLLALMMTFPDLLEGLLPGWIPGWRGTTMLYHSTLRAAFPLIFFLFARFFPEPFPKDSGYDRAWRVMQWVFALPFILFALAGIIVSAKELNDYQAAAALSRYLQPDTPLTATLRYDLTLLLIGSFFAAMWIKLRLSRSPDSRRRMSFLNWGALVAFGPSLIAVIYARMLGKSLPEVFDTWVVVVLLIPMAIFPLTLAYVIVVQRAMGVGVALRQGIQYTLARSGVRILQILAITVVLVAAFAMVSNGHNRVEKIIAIAAGITAYFTITKLADRLRTWVDRRFFREAYNSEQVLTDLSDQVRSMVEPKTLLETVAARISETLHVPQVAVLLDGEGTFRPAFATGYDGALPSVAFPRNMGMARVLARQREPARVFLHDRDSWLYREVEVSEEERGKLAVLHSELLLPLAVRDELLGFISLGPKRSEEPYTGSDVRLLKSVATQTGLALENASLMHTIADEAAHRERLHREVEIAREVQERLFPQKRPAIAGLDYAGHCRPALGVGGDYFDFLALPQGQLGIAVGDVSGKGIAAALMMASLEACLRGEAARAPEHLDQSVANISRLMYEASSSNRYASLFYGQYDPATGRFVYVNAGHNAPMLFHCAEGLRAISRLDVGGVVIGLLEAREYQQSSVMLHPGDLLVAFTDGISEAMNAAEEEWGEDRLIETVQGCDSLCAQEIINRIFKAVDEFVAGAQQHDDMTLVILRLLPGAALSESAPGL